MCPWILLLFIGIVDFGFYIYAAMAVQNGARAAALATGVRPSSAGNTGLACRYAREELRYMTNFSSLPTDCAALPLRVQAFAEVDAFGANMTRVQVDYQPVRIFSTFISMGPFTRTTRMRVYGD